MTTRLPDQRATADSGVRATTSEAGAPPAEVKAASGAEQDRLIATVVVAFSRDPVVRWLYPQPDQYLAHWPDFVRAFGGLAFEHGTAHYSGEYFGAALWLPPGVSPDEEALVSLIQQTVPEHTQADLFAVLEQMGGYHPSEPHWYLPLIGVDPARQHGGLGSALLKYALELCDRDNKMAYLESSHPLNVPLYERHGFEVAGAIQAGTSPTIWPMVRKPRQAGLPKALQHRI